MPAVATDPVTERKAILLTSDCRSRTRTSVQGSPSASSPCPGSNGPTPRPSAKRAPRRTDAQKARQPIKSVSDTLKATNSTWRNTTADNLEPPARLRADAITYLIDLDIPHEHAIPSLHLLPHALRARSQG